MTTFTARLRERVIEQAAGERSADVAHIEWGGANQRLWMLPAKGAVFLELLLHKFIEQVMIPLLGRSFLLSSLTANIAGRGGEEMVLHSDQGYISFPTPRPVVANIMWMLSDFTDDNGATRLVPGSHRRPEIIFLTLPDDVVASLPDRLKNRLGWKMWAGLGKTGQGQQRGDVFVQRVARPIGELRADGTPK